MRKILVIRATTIWQHRYWRHLYNEPILPHAVRMVHLVLKFYSLIRVDEDKIYVFVDIPFKNCLRFKSRSDIPNMTMVVWRKSCLT